MTKLKYSFCLLPIGLAVLAIIGWLWDIDILKRGPGNTEMNPTTAVCLIVLGLETARLLNKTESSYLRLGGCFGVLLVMTISILRLFDVIFQTHFHVDKILFAQKLAGEAAIPNQMAPNTALCFLFLGIVIFLLRTRSERMIVAAQLLTVIPISIGLLALLGYVYEVQSLYTVGLLVAMAINTAVAFILLSLSVWTVFPDCRLAKIVINDGPAGQTARLLLPTCILAPSVLGWLRIMGVRAKWFDGEFGIALSVSSSAAILLLVTFITARQLYLADLQRKKAEQNLNQFYALVVHELRSPLTSIGGSVSLLMRGMVETHSDRSFQLLSIARLETDRMLRLVNDLLDLKKIEEGKWQLNISSAEPAQIVVLALDGLKGMASISKVSLTSAINSQAAIQCDSDRLQQVLTNLVSNAIKFSPPESKVSVSVDDIASGIKFSIIDCGPGIAADQIPRLFKKFEQLSPIPETEYRGTGLGLAIAKEIVQQHGGEIGIDSEHGKGATFWFTVPR